MSAILSYIVVKINAEDREAREKLLVEESGKEVATLQGLVAGHSFFLSAIAGAFTLGPAFMEDNGERDDMALADLSGEAFAELASQAIVIKTMEEWGKILARLAEKEEALKVYLLHSADKGRDLHFSQAFFKGMTAWQAVFDAIGDEEKRRRAEVEKAARELALFGGSPE